MGHAIPSQHPAVVLRSHYNHLRALLAVAMIAIVGLTAAVVILATDGDQVSSTSTARPIEPLNYGSSRINPSTGYPETASQPLPSSTRYDGGPEEGTRGISPSPEVHAHPLGGARYDGGPEEGTRGPGFRTN